jgi:hypothetical protein
MESKIQTKKRGSFHLTKEIIAKPFKAFYNKICSMPLLSSNMKSGKQQVKKNKLTFEKVLADRSCSRYMN